MHLENHTDDIEEFDDNFYLVNSRILVEQRASRQLSQSGLNLSRALSRSSSKNLPSSHRQQIKANGLHVSSASLAVPPFTCNGIEEKKGKITQLLEQQIKLSFHTDQIDTNQPRWKFLENTHERNEMLRRRSEQEEFGSRRDFQLEMMQERIMQTKIKSDELAQSEIAWLKMFDAPPANNPQTQQAQLNKEQLLPQKDSDAAEKVEYFKLRSDKRLIAQPKDSSKDLKAKAEDATAQEKQQMDMFRELVKDELRSQLSEEIQKQMLQSIKEQVQQDPAFLHQILSEEVDKNSSSLLSSNFFQKISEQSNESSKLSSRSQDSQASNAKQQGIKPISEHQENDSELSNNSQFDNKQNDKVSKQIKKLIRNENKYNSDAMSNKEKKDEDDQNLEDEMLRSQYDQYEQKQRQKNKQKKTDKRVNQIRASRDRTDIQQQSNHSVKKARSVVRRSKKSKNKSFDQSDSKSSQKYLNHFDNDNESVQKGHVRSEHPTKKEKSRKRRINKTQTMSIRSLKVGTSNEHKNTSQEVFRNIDLSGFQSEDGLVDTLLLQMEKQRIELAIEIGQLVNKKSKSSDSIQQQSPSSGNYTALSTTAIQEFVDVLKQLGLPSDSACIASLDQDQSLHLKTLISQYRNMLKDQKKYKNVENIDNESKSEDLTSVPDNPQYQVRLSSEQEIDEVSQTEDESHSNISSHSLSDNNGDESPQQANIELNSQAQDQPPSLRSIGRRSSYRSLDSKHVRAVAIKFRPKNSNNSNGKTLGQQGSSGLRSLKDSHRRERMESLDTEYSEYLQQYQGFFIIRCQMMNIELSKMKEKGLDIDKMLRGQKNLKRLQREVEQDRMFYHMQTIVIDIENTLITQIEVKNCAELHALSERENFAQDYIIIDKSKFKKSKKEVEKQEKDNQPCCDLSGSKDCVCNIVVYQVRPYTYEILRAMQPFFEVVVFSKMHHRMLENIIEHIEFVLNRPIMECLKKYQNQKQKSRLMRMKKLPDIKVYFQYIIHQRQYLNLGEPDQDIENLYLLMQNRRKDNLIFISSNPFRIMAAIRNGFLVLPVLQYEVFYRDDFQLSLVENYILKIRHLKNMKSKIQNDFKFLMTKIEKARKSGDASPTKQTSRQKDAMKIETGFEINSLQSFGRVVREKMINKHSSQLSQGLPSPNFVNHTNAQANDSASNMQQMNQRNVPKTTGTFFSFSNTLHNDNQPNANNDVTTSNSQQVLLRPIQAQSLEIQKQNESQNIMQQTAQQARRLSLSGDQPSNMLIKLKIQQKKSTFFSDSSVSAEQADDHSSISSYNQSKKHLREQQDKIEEEQKKDPPRLPYFQPQPQPEIEQQDVIGFTNFTEAVESFEICERKGNDQSDCEEVKSASNTHKSFCQQDSSSEEAKKSERQIDTNSPAQPSKSQFCNNIEQQNLIKRSLQKSYSTENDSKEVSLIVTSSPTKSGEINVLRTQSQHQIVNRQLIQQYDDLNANKTGSQKKPKTNQDSSASSVQESSAYGSQITSQDDISVQSSFKQQQSKKSSDGVKHCLNEKGHIHYDASAVIIEESKSSLMGSRVQSISSHDIIDSVSSKTDSPRRSESIQSDDSCKGSKFSRVRRKNSVEYHQIDENENEADDVVDSQSVRISEQLSKLDHTPHSGKCISSNKNFGEVNNDEEVKQQQE